MRELGMRSLFVMLAMPPSSGVERRSLVGQRRGADVRATCGIIGADPAELDGTTDAEA
jgi:hypothetical protein